MTYSRELFHLPSTTYFPNVRLLLRQNKQENIMESAQWLSDWMSFLLDARRAQKVFTISIALALHNSNPDEQWKCHPCKTKQTQQLSQNRLVSQPISTAAHHNLSTLEWNAVSNMTKLSELRDMLINSSINICTVQESNFCKINKTPIVDVFVTILKDHKELNGGALLLFICNNLTFEQLNSAEKVGIEIQSICIWTSKSQWLYLHNVYLQNTKTYASCFDTNIIRATANLIIVGNFKDHCPL